MSKRGGYVYVIVDDWVTTLVLSMAAIAAVIGSAVGIAIHYGYL